MFIKNSIISAKFLRRAGRAAEVFFCAAALAMGALALAAPQATAQDLTVQGGDGANGSPSVPGPGADGANDVRTITIETYDNLSVLGGNGGNGDNGGPSMGDGMDGGNGGNAGLTAEDITVNGDLTVASCLRGQDGQPDGSVPPNPGGLGGAAGTFVGASSLRAICSRLSFPSADRITLA